MHVLCGQDFQNQQENLFDIKKLLNELNLFKINVSESFTLNELIRILCNNFTKTLQPEQEPLIIKEVPQQIYTANTKYK